MAREKLFLVVTRGIVTAVDSWGSKDVDSSNSPWTLFQKNPGGGPSNPQGNPKVLHAKLKVRAGREGAGGPTSGAFDIQAVYKDKNGNENNGNGGKPPPERIYSYDTSPPQAGKAHPHRVRDKPRRGKGRKQQSTKAIHTSVRRNMSGGKFHGAVITRGLHRITVTVE